MNQMNRESGHVGRQVHNRSNGVHGMCGVSASARSAGSQDDSRVATRPRAELPGMRTHALGETDGRGATCATRRRTPLAYPPPCVQAVARPPPRARRLGLVVAHLGGSRLVVVGRVDDHRARLHTPRDARLRSCGFSCH
ncbi:hypothetical protein SEVIR_6G219250v4 [Setaria viridis]